MTPDDRITEAYIQEWLRRAATELPLLVPYSKEKPPMFTRQFLADLAERVVASAAGAAVAALGGDAVDMFQVNAHLVIGLAGGAALVSLLKGLAARFVGSKDTASLVS